MINKIVKKEFYIFMVLLGIIIMLMGLLTSFSFSKYLFKEEFVAFRIQNENAQMKNNVENKAKEKVEVEVNKDDIPSLIEIVTIKH